MMYNSGMYAEAAAPVETSISIEQTVSADSLADSSGGRVNTLADTQANTASETSTSKLAKAVQFKSTINRDNTSRTVKASKKATKAAKLKKANNIKIKKSITNSVTDYQQNGNQTSFMFEFYNGTLERVLFS